jgi:hypothetical protein
MSPSSMHCDGRSDALPRMSLIFCLVTVVPALRMGNVTQLQDFWVATLLFELSS